MCFLEKREETGKRIMGFRASVVGHHIWKQGRTGRAKFPVQKICNMRGPDQLISKFYFFFSNSKIQGLYSV